MSPDASRTDPDVAVGFTQVDAQPDTARLVAAMEVTAMWPAVRYLRAWERERLALGPGDRVLDVGCGLGDVASALAAAVAPGGKVVGLDGSEAMLAVARQRAPGVEFRIADALALEVPDASFDACRSERTLQWLSDIDGAISEMVRVLRAGGRLSLIDSDWRTFTVDVPDLEAVAAVRTAHEQIRGPSAAAGGRMLNLCRDHGLVDLECTGAPHVWTSWDPDDDPAPPGLFPLRTVIQQLAELGLVEPALASRFVEGVVEAARRDRLWISLTMFAVAGRRP
jgi:SAM-dependent methyltransferase